MAGQGRRQVSSGDIMAEIETDKATMEFEAVDEGTIARFAFRKAPRA
jgi:pyruvate/2-oxoglutarate dehydrogenase complex dihydrolipoamide acyltransferase (E2) component